MMWSISTQLDRLIQKVKRLKVILKANDAGFRRIPAEPNWHGVPKPGLTWDEVRKGTQEINPIIPMTMPYMPKCCPECEKKLLDYESDWTKIESSGQYMVWGLYCPEGHWTHLEWA